jgi:hypothetical protein
VATPWPSLESPFRLLSPAPPGSLAGRAKKPTPLEEKLSRVRASRTDEAPPPAVSDAHHANEAGAPRAAAPSRPRGGYRRRSTEPSYAERVPRATFYIDRAIQEQLDAVCRQHGFNKSEFVREAIVRHMATLG